MAMRPPWQKRIQSAKHETTSSKSGSRWHSIARAGHFRLRAQKAGAGDAAAAASDGSSAADAHACAAEAQPANSQPEAAAYSNAGRAA